jgi:hypothetical protein
MGKGKPKGGRKLAVRGTYERLTGMGGFRNIRLGTAEARCDTLTKRIAGFSCRESGSGASMNALYSHQLRLLTIPTSSVKSTLL